MFKLYLFDYLERLPTLLELSLSRVSVT